MNVNKIFIIGHCLEFYKEKNKRSLKCRRDPIKYNFYCFLFYFIYLLFTTFVFAVVSVQMSYFLFDVGAVVLSVILSENKDE